MSVSRLQLTKSETRDMAERDHRAMASWRLGEPADWNMSNGTFFTAFVVIAAVLAALALILQ